MYVSDVTFLRALVMNVRGCAVAGCPKDLAVGRIASARETLLGSVVVYWDALAKEREDQRVLEENGMRNSCILMEEIIRGSYGTLSWLWSS